MKALIFSLKTLDDNLTKQQDIINLEINIKKYFFCSKWCYFNNKNRECKRKYLSLIKSIFKNMGISITSKTYTKKTNTEKYYETKYKIVYL